MSAHFVIRHSSFLFPALLALASLPHAARAEVIELRITHRAPLATYAGWNVRRDESGAGGMLSRLAGSQWPLARDHREREQTGDPRLSIQERYPTHEIYLARIAQAALELQAQGFLLEEDVLEILKKAAQWKEWGS